MFFRACSLQNEVCDPQFFYISDITDSLSFNGKIFGKKSMLENFRANVFKVFLMTWAVNIKNEKQNAKVGLTDTQP